MNIQAKFQALHRRLLPPDLRQGYLPYLWLVYLSFIFFPLIWFDGSTGEQWLVATLVCVIFLWLYFKTYWWEGKNALLGIAAICVLGSIASFFTDGASVLFVFAGAFAFKAGTPRNSVVVLLAVLSYVLSFSILTGRSPFFYFPGLLFTALIGVINIYQCEMDKKDRQLKLSQEELSRVAATAERERIARDLHDLVGHTFSMITMKAQLAAKLVDVDKHRAKQEMMELEQVSRRTLSEVREAVSRYKKRDLDSELAIAKVAIQSAERVYCCQRNTEKLTADIEEVLAFIIRESVTNTLRHSDGDEFQVLIQQHDHEVHLIVNDDGEVEEWHEGNGIAGIRERLSEVNGKLNIDTSTGFTLNIKVPL